jgi:hypothetical protein
MHRNAYIPPMPIIGSITLVVCLMMLMPWVSWWQEMPLPARSMWALFGGHGSPMSIGSWVLIGSIAMPSLVFMGSRMHPRDLHRSCIGYLSWTAIVGCAQVAVAVATCMPHTASTIAVIDVIIVCLFISMVVGITGMITDVDIVSWYRPLRRIRRRIMSPWVARHGIPRWRAPGSEGWMLWAGSVYNMIYLLTIILGYHVLYVCMGAVSGIMALMTGILATTACSVGNAHISRMLMKRVDGISYRSTMRWDVAWDLAIMATCVTIWMTGGPGSSAGWVLWVPVAYATLSIGMHIMVMRAIRVHHRVQSDSVIMRGSDPS